MDIEEYQARSLKIGRGLHALLDDMYAAIDEETTLDIVRELLESANTKIKQYESLLAESSEVWQEGLKKNYLSWIEDVHEFIKQLKEKYPESNS